MRADGPRVHSRRRLTGSGCNSRASTLLNIATFAPVSNAIETMQMAVSARGGRESARRAAILPEALDRQEHAGDGRIVP